MTISRFLACVLLLVPLITRSDDEPLPDALLRLLPPRSIAAIDGDFEATEAAIDGTRLWPMPRRVSTADAMVLIDAARWEFELRATGGGDASDLRALCERYRPLMFPRGALALDGSLFLDASLDIFKEIADEQPLFAKWRKHMYEEHTVVGPDGVTKHLAYKLVRDELLDPKDESNKATRAKTIE